MEDEGPPDLIEANHSTNESTRGNDTSEAARKVPITIVTGQA